MQLKSVCPGPLLPLSHPNDPHPQRSGRLSMSVNSNVAALAVQRSLLNNTRELATSMQRLNTGVRINSAADDAAGVSIADRMESQIKSYGMAIRNAGDAISILETAEGGLGSIADTLQRMRVLATAAANGTTV
ncbi:MAG: hypothetical protein FGM43_11245, partial [Sinobacteraceae bacterium]|nr:hypothetical protein [Nevskiaceae bacterium]